MKHFVKLLLTTSLVALSSFVYAVTPTAPATPTAINVSPAEQAKIEQVVHNYLVQHPEVLIESMQVLQQKQFAQAQQTVQQTQKIAANFADPLFHQSNDPIAGNPNGAITIVEFFDYQCPHCIDMAPNLASIAKSNPNLRIIYKEFPIRGAVSDFASRAALAANLQGKYIVLHDALMTSKTEPLTQDAILKLAAGVGIDVTKLQQDMNGQTVNDQIKANVKLAQDLKLFGTPALFIGKSNNKNNQGAINYIPGQMDQTQLQQAVETASK